jgi:hypothetical protein
MVATEEQTKGCALHQRQCFFFNVLVISGPIQVHLDVAAVIDAKLVEEDALFRSRRQKPGEIPNHLGSSRGPFTTAHSTVERNSHDSNICTASVFCADFSPWIQIDHTNSSFPVN